MGISSNAIGSKPASLISRWLLSPPAVPMGFPSEFLDALARLALLPHNGLV